MSNEPQKPSDKSADPHFEEHFRKHIRQAIGVFIALIVLTIVTVLASYVNLGHVGNIALALIIATFKSGLVAAVFMHLMGEKRMIFRVLIFTLFFFAGLFVLILGTMSNPIHLK